MDEIYLILGMAFVTFMVRYPVLAILRRFSLPIRITNALKFIPPAILAAIISPALLLPGGDQIELTPYNPKLIAGVFAMVVAWRTKNLLWTILAGMLVLWLLLWIIP